MPNFGRNSPQQLTYMHCNNSTKTSGYLIYRLLFVFLILAIDSLFGKSTRVTASGSVVTLQDPKSPEGGNKAIRLMSRPDVLNPDHRITKKGLFLFQKIKQDYALVLDPGINAKVNEIGERIVEGAGLRYPGIDWEFIVIDSPDEVQAVALPGGKVAVFSGLLDHLGSDDDLAVVVGHEIAHLASNHQIEEKNRAFWGTLANVAVIALDLSGEIESPFYNKSLTELSLDVTGDILRGYSRRSEREADFVGLFFAALAGFDPTAGVEVWQRINAIGSANQPPAYYSTHPPEELRLTLMREYEPSAKRVYYQALSGSVDFPVGDLELMFRTFSRQVDGSVISKVLDFSSFRTKKQRSAIFLPVLLEDNRPLLSVGTNRLGLENAWGVPTRVYLSSEDILEILSNAVSEEASTFLKPMDDYSVSGSLNDFYFEMGFSPVAMKYLGFVEVDLEVKHPDGSLILEKNYISKQTRSDYTGFVGGKVVRKLFGDCMKDIREQFRSDLMKHQF